MDRQTARAQWQPSLKRAKDFLDEEDQCSFCTPPLASINARMVIQCGQIYYVNGLIASAPFARRVDVFNCQTPEKKHAHGR